MKLSIVSKLIIAAVMLFVSACDTVAFYEKERLNDPAMQFDSDPLYSQMRQHMLTPREGAIGGFSTIGAGGCSCK